jgi:2-methylcitrate dehydratase
VVEGLAGQQAGALGTLNIVVDPSVLDKAPTIPPGIF